MSRPFLPREVRRNNSVTARFTDEETSMMRSIARCDGTTLSNTVRELCIIGINAQTKGDPCGICTMKHDTKGNIEFNIETLDPKCFKCLMKQMIASDPNGGYKPLLLGEDNIPLVV
jgi:hypothetical protein